MTPHPSGLSRKLPAPAGLALATLLAVGANAALRFAPGPWRWIALLYLPALALFVWLAPAPQPWPDPPASRPWTRHGLYVTLAGAALGLAALLGFWLRKDLYGGWPFILWLAGTALFLVGLGLSEHRVSEKPADTPARGLHAPLPRGWEIGLLVAILLAAFFLRVWDLNAIPNGCQSDECNNALDALLWQEGKPYMPYAGTNAGQATLFTYIISLVFKLAGANMVTLRATSAIMGVLTLLAFYGFARWHFRSPKLALVLIGLLAACRWHITFSRIVYELIMVPLVITLLLWALLRAQKEGRRLDWALAGVCIALGMNTYTAFRVVPFWIALYLLYVLAGMVLRKAHRPGLIPTLQGIGLFGAGGLLAGAPLMVYILRNWNQFLTRTRDISVFNDVQRIGSWQPVWDNLLKTLKMFHMEGDFAALNNLPQAPLLDVAVGALFLLGVALCLRYAGRLLPFLCLTGIPFQLSLVVLSAAHEAPSARRPIGILVIVFLLAGEVLARLWPSVGEGNRSPWPRRLLGIGLSLWVIGSLLVSGYTYFFVQAARQDVQMAYSPYESAVGRYVHDLPANTLVLVTSAYQHHSALRFIGGREIVPLDLLKHLPMQEQVEHDVVYILDIPLESLVTLLKLFYPDGIYEEHADVWKNRQFLTYRVPAETMQQAQGLKAHYYAGETISDTPAAEDRLLSLDQAFSEESPLPAPFTAELSGALMVPAFGTYTFTVSSKSHTELFLDGQAVLETEAGQKSVALTLVGGFTPIRLVHSVPADGAPLSVAWASPDGASQPLASPAIQAIDVGPNGLVGYYYPNAEWQDPPTVIRRDLLIMPNDILNEPYSVRWIGKLAIPAGGEYGFATSSDDGSYLYIDKALVVDNGGSHGAQLAGGKATLDKGFHELELRYYQSSGGREMILYWTPPGGTEVPLPADYLFPIESTDLPADLALPPPPALPTPTPRPEPAQQEGSSEALSAGPTVILPTAPPLAEASQAPLGEEALWAVGSCGTGKGQFNEPRGLAASSNGVLYVADTANQRIVVMNREGDFTDAFGEGGDGPGQLLEPFEVELDAKGGLWVLDAGRSLVLHFDARGRFVEEVAPQGTSLSHPRGFTLAEDGSLLIADTGGLRLLQMDSAGRQLRQIGGPEAELGPGQPTDVAVSPTGDIYAVEPRAGQIWHLNSAGQPLSRWEAGMTHTVDSPHLALLSDGRLAHTEPDKRVVNLFAADGTPAGSLGDAELWAKPVGVAADPDGTVLYVSDRERCRIVAVRVP